MRPRRRRHPTSPPATPLDDEDLLAEFLLRLPLRPCSLPCAAAVCKSWRRVVTDPHFLRRFRTRHGTPPLLGFFDPYGRFFPTLKASDRVPSARLSGNWNMVACRDGLVLRSRGSKLQVLDLMTGDRSTISTSEVKLPLTLKVDLAIDSTSVDRLRFNLIALSTDVGHTRLSASVYSSDSGTWVHFVQTLVLGCTIGFMRSLSTFVGDAFYCLHEHVGILHYDLGTQAVGIIDIPWNVEEGYEYDCRYLFMTKDGLLCIVLLDEHELTIQFLVLDTILSSDCAARFVQRKSVLLDTPLPPEVQLYWPALRIVWVEEENNEIFLWTHTGIVMFNLESMKCMKVSEEIGYNKIYPYSSFMTAGRDVGLFSDDVVHDRFTEASE